MSQTDTPAAAKQPDEKQLRARLRHVNKELAALKRSDALWTTSFRYSPAALCIVTLGENTVRDVNRRFSEITGYAREALIGQPVASLFAADAANPFAPAGDMPADSTTSMPAAFVAADGEAHSAIWQVQIVEVHKELCAIATLTDLTDGHQRELALNRSAADLQTRVSELETQNDAMRSHEERTLAQINTMVQETQQLKLDLVQAQRLYDELREETRRIRARVGQSLPAPASASKKPGSADTAMARLFRMLRGKVEAPVVIAPPTAGTLPNAALPTFASDEPPAELAAPEPAATAEAVPAMPAAAPLAAAEPASVPAAPERLAPVIRVPVSAEHINAHIAALRQLADRIDAELGVA